MTKPKYNESNKLNVRQFILQDNEIVWKLHFAGLDQMGANAGKGPWDDDLNHIEEVYLQNGGEFLIGEYKGQIVAMGALKKTSDTKAEVKRMRVDPKFQGRGFGQRMLEELEKRARELGYTVLHLDTSTKQGPAQKLYLKNGYKEVGRATFHGLETILYEKQLV
ncbi:GNAT family N-acetyltransferase [Candidatus Gottesmanbacteria bacterium]|nr:GNAT family N-acetyltransferase [Candidatus Gottesmanbacteria bacterium]